MSGMSYLEMQKQINNHNAGLRLDQLKGLLDRNDALESACRVLRERVMGLEAKIAEFIDGEDDPVKSDRVKRNED